MTASDLEPPSYEDAVDQPSTNNAPATFLPSSNVYISSRPYTEPTPSDIITHKLDILTPNFPTPEGAWLNRDVRNQDWETFVAQLHRPAAEKETESQWRRRTDYVISEWNDEFFAPRGTRIEIGAAELTKAGETQAEGSKGKGWTSKIGFALPPESNGIGLRIGGGLLGVQWGGDKKKEEKKEDTKEDTKEEKKDEKK